MGHLSLRVNDDQLIKGLKLVAKTDRVSVSDVSREALRRYLAVRRLQAVAAKITKRAAAKGIVTGEDAERIALKGLHRCR